MQRASSHSPRTAGISAGGMQQASSNSPRAYPDSNALSSSLQAPSLIQGQSMMYGPSQMQQQPPWPARQQMPNAQLQAPQGLTPPQGLGSSPTWQPAQTQLQPGLENQGGAVGGRNASPLRSPARGAPLGWQPSQAFSQGRPGLEELEALMTANLLTETLPVRSSPVPTLPTEILVEAAVAAAVEAAKGGSSSSKAITPSRSSPQKSMEAKSPAKDDCSGGPGEEIALSSRSRIQTFSFADAGPADGTQDSSTSALSNRFDSTWKMVQSSFEHLVGLSNVQPSALFSACTKVPGNLTSSRAGERSQGEFSLGCLHVEQSILQQQKQDALFEAIATSDLSSAQVSAAATTLRRRLYLRTSPLTLATAQSGGELSSIIGYGESLPQGTSSPSASADGLSSQQPGCGAGKQLLDSLEVHDAMLVKRCFMCSLKGNKSSAPNQDRAISAALGAAEMYAVFDGHGEHGHFSAELCNEILPKLLLRGLVRASPAASDQNPQDAADVAGGWQEATRHAFLQAHGMLEEITMNYLREGKTTGQKDVKVTSLDARASGTTGTMLFKAGDSVLVAHTGDSRAVLGTRPHGVTKWRVIELTQDHKPDLPEEVARIERAGAQIIVSGYAPNQVSRIFTPQQPWPMINMTRSLGDLHAHTQGLSADPEVRVHQRLWNSSAEDAVLLICSDGIWDVINSDLAIEIVAEHLSKGMDPASGLAAEAYQRWRQRGLPNNYSDDITVIVKFF